jgi:hypothetical protein
MIEATNKMIDLTKTGGLRIEMILSAPKKIMSSAEAIIALAKTMVFVMQIIIFKANMLISFAEKIIFVSPAVLHVRQTVYGEMGGVSQRWIQLRPSAAGFFLELQPARIGNNLGNLAARSGPVSESLTAIAR